MKRKKKKKRKDKLRDFAIYTGASTKRNSCLFSLVQMSEFSTVIHSLMDQSTKIQISLYADDDTVTFHCLMQPGLTNSNPEWKSVWKFKLWGSGFRVRGSFPCSTVVNLAGAPDSNRQLSMYKPDL